MFIPGDDVTDEEILLNHLKLCNFITGEKLSKSHKTSRSFFLYKIKKNMQKTPGRNFALVPL